MYRIRIPDDVPLFFTSDIHFSHLNICRFCKRPFTSTLELNLGMIERWNAVVPEDAIVVNCGDFVLRHKNKNSHQLYKRLAGKLNGRQVLVRGNHDKVDINTVDDEGKFIAIVDIAEIIYRGKKIIASHYPLTAYTGDYNVYGHVHTLGDGKIHGIDNKIMKNLDYTTQYDVGVDQNNLAPISYDSLIDIFDREMKKQLDTL